MSPLEVWARHFARSEQLQQQWSKDLKNPNATVKFLRVVRKLLAAQRRMDSLFTAHLEARFSSLEDARTTVNEFKQLCEQYRKLKHEIPTPHS